MALYPVFIDLAGRRCVVVGGGEVAVRKARALREAGAEVRVVSPAPHQALDGLEGVELCERPYARQLLVGADLVIACTDQAELNGRVYEDCRSLGIWCNVADDPDRCDFQVPAVLCRGLLQIAVSTGGASPALAGTIRDELGGQFGPAFEQWLRQLKRVRGVLMLELDDVQLRREVLQRLGSAESLALFRRGSGEQWEQWAWQVAGLGERGEGQG